MLIKFEIKMLMKKIVPMYFQYFKSAIITIYEVTAQSPVLFKITNSKKRIMEKWEFLGENCF